MQVRERAKNGGIYVIPVIIFLVLLPVTDQIWQDYVLLFATLLISVTLVPTLLEPEAAVPRTTSVPAALAVALFVIGMVGLELWLTAGANVLSFILWCLVILRRAP